MLHEILSNIGKYCVEIISMLGYPGITVLMALESMIAPVPSELVMPFAGFLAGQGNMSFLFVIVASSVGSFSGSVISYYVGYYGGDRVTKKFGKYLLLDLEDLEKTEKWFSRRGDVTIFVSRFIPVVRHLISIPAGIGKMNILKFSLYTVCGATIWNSFLAYLGFILGERWESVKYYSDYVSIPAAILLLVAGCYFVYRHAKHKIKKK